MRLATGLMLLALVCALGCGGSGPKMYPVSGTVKLEDGKLLPTGFITFMPDGGSGAPASGPIKDGNYSFKSLPGKVKVEITADREVGAVDATMGAPRREPYIDDKYNVATELRAEVTPAGPNKFDFTVGEKKPVP